MIPLLKLLDENLDIVTLVDDYKNLYFEEKYNDIGSCSLTMSVDAENFKYFKKNMFIYLNKYQCFYIEEIDISKNEATISCLTLDFLFAHRIIIPPPGKSHLQVANKLTGEIAKVFIEQCLVSATDTRRNIPMVFEEYAVGHYAIYESRFSNLLDEVQVLCNYSAIGFKVGLDLQNKRFVCSIYEGRNMQEDIIFCEEYDNIDDIKINDSNAGYKNKVFIASEGEGAERPIYEMSDGDFSGFTLREDIVEAKIDKEQDEEGNEIPVDIANIIQITGSEFLEENCEKTSIEALVLESIEEIEVGDIVTIISHKYNLKFTQRIIEVNTEYSQDSGKTVAIVVGNQKPLLTFNTDKKEIK